MSGTRYWSDSAIRVKPSIDEPSNHVPWRTEPSSWWIGIVTALTTPRMSVNWSWMKRMPPSRAASMRASASLAVLDRQCALLRDPGGRRLCAQHETADASRVTRGV